VRTDDVTSGSAFYGPGRSYHKLVGKDATRAFCTGCLEPECLISSVAGLAPSQLREADKWIELYEHHDKYKLIGQVRGEIAEVAEEEGEAVAEAEVDSRTPNTDSAADAAHAAAAAAAAAWEHEQVERAQEVEGRRRYKPFRPR
jgi:hypothetical protein